MDDKDVFILYGSQTGNSEDIAKDLHEKCSKGKIRSVCKNLNSVKKVDLKGMAKCVVIVCSTTGNGDTPENADAWWRSVKLRSAPKDTFADIPYAVLGLGDTNYDQFCHMGKMIDKRLKELGGNRFHPLCCADEATGLEETVETWKAEVMVLLNKLDQIIEASAAEASKASETVDASVAPLAEAAPVISIESPISSPEGGIPLGLLKVSAVSDWLQISQQIISPPESSQLPNIKKVLTNGPIVRVLDSTDGSHSKKTTAKPTDGWSAATPFHASIGGARWLTTKDNIMEDSSIWGQKKRVLHMEFNLSGSGIEYLPGDSVGICCPNPSFLVRTVFLRLKEVHTEPSFTLDSLISVSVSGEDVTSTLEEILTYKIDLTGVPRKTNVLALAEFCKEKSEQAEVQWLCSKGDIGKQLWGQFVEAQRVGLGEFFTLFPSCKPTLSALLACSGSMPPRFYSIASSPAKKKNSAAVAFSCVRYTCGLTVPCKANAEGKANVLKRSGVCTFYLESLLKNRLDGALDTLSQEKVRLFLKPSITFRLPGSVSPPLILIGPGTGVAPFMGFLEHRAVLQKEKKYEGGEITTGTWRGGFELDSDDLPHECNNVGRFIQSNPAGPVTLFFGCRDDGDYLYREELERNVRDGTLTSLQVAQSRAGPEKVYVTHKLKEMGAEIARFLLHEGGYVYICGDGNSMAKDVYAAIRGVLKEHGGLSEDEAEEALDDLKLRRRYIMDIWS